MNMLIAIALTFVAVIGSSTLHYEAIQRLDRLARRSSGAYPALLFVICGLVALHLVEIGIYAAIFHLADQTLVLGDFDGKAFRRARIVFITQPKPMPPSATTT